MKFTHILCCICRPLFLTRAVWQQIQKPCKGGRCSLRSLQDEASDHNRGLENSRRLCNRPDFENAMALAMKASLGSALSVHQSSHRAGARVWIDSLSWDG